MVQRAIFRFARTQIYSSNLIFMTKQTEKILDLELHRIKCLLRVVAGTRASHTIMSTQDGVSIKIHHTMERIKSQVSTIDSTTP